MATGSKTGGRSKGTPNKNTVELREKFTLLLENNFDKLQNDIDLLEPKDRVKTLLDVAKFVVPTLKATDLGIDSKDITISFAEPIDYSKYSDEDLIALQEIESKYEVK